MLSFAGSVAPAHRPQITPLSKVQAEFGFLPFQRTSLSARSPLSLATETSHRSPSPDTGSTRTKSYPSRAPLPQERRSCISFMVEGMSSKPRIQKARLASFRRISFGILQARRFVERLAPSTVSVHRESRERALFSRSRLRSSMRWRAISTSSNSGFRRRISSSSGILPVETWLSLSPDISYRTKTNNQNFPGSQARSSSSRPAQM